MPRYDAACCVSREWAILDWNNPESNGQGFAEPMRYRSGG